MNLPSLCHDCHKHHHSTVAKACPFCRDVQLPEATLCDLVRGTNGDEQTFHCAAFRPTLSVVNHDETESSHTQEGSENTVSISPKDRWFRAYAVQQLGMHPDLISFAIRYHVVLSTRQRNNVFSSEHREPMVDLVRQTAFPFQQTQISALWLASDHIHLSINTSPDYSLDEIVHAIRGHLEHAMTNLLPTLKHSNQPCWEQAYFAEGIG